MIAKRIVIAGAGVVVLVAVVIGLWAFGFEKVNTAKAQGTPPNTMSDRLDQVIRLLQNGPPGAGAGAMDGAMEILYGGLRILPSPEEPNTEVWHEQTSENELRLAQALEVFAMRGNVDPEDQRRAVDLKLFIEQMNDVAQAVAVATRFCGEGMSLQEQPCDQLQPLLDEVTGHERRIGHVGDANIPDFTEDERDDRQTGQVRNTIVPGFTVKLRSPFVPQWTGWWEEDVVVTEPIGNDECVVVFKETKGLMLRLHFEKIIIVSDPWATATLPRGTQIPVWRMEWVPSEYVKQFNICNTGRGKLVKSVDQRVKQDIPLNYFWRFYHKDN